MAFEAAHIWPLSKGMTWLESNISRWITDSEGISAEAKMNSPQNGILLRSDMHKYFDNYSVGVNPKVGYVSTGLGFVFKSDLRIDTLLPQAIDESPAQVLS